MTPGVYGFLLFQQNSWSYYSLFYPDSKYFSRNVFKLLLDENNESCKNSRFNKCLENFYKKEWANWRTKN